MAYDNSSLTGDEICDYYYDIENNLVNPESPSGYFIYKIIGGAFDWLNDLVTQFRIDYSILDCNVGDVEIVNGFPEEPNTNHTYYVHQYNTSTDACFTKYSFVDGEWVSETVTGDVLNSLDVFWGRSYNLPRPLLYEGQKADYLFIDNGTTASHNDTWYRNSGTDNRTVTVNGTTLANTTSTRYDIFAYYGISGQIYVFQPPYTVELDIVDIVGSNARFQIYDNVTRDTYNGNFTVGHWKIVYDGTTIKPYKNGVEQTNYTRDMPNARIGFYIPQDCSITYKNFKVYTGEDKERPLNDEEYRIYLYLKNHQLLTMKDLLVAFTNAFGSAETSTTLLNSIHTVDHKRYDNPPFTNVTLAAYDEEDTDIITDNLVDKAGVNVVNDRLAQGTLSIQIPDDGWDEEFLSLLESFISIKGNILISQGG